MVNRTASPLEFLQEGTDQVWALAPQLAVLSALAVVFFLLARRLARRWEIV